MKDHAAVNRRRWQAALEESRQHRLFRVGAGVE